MESSLPVKTKSLNLSPPVAILIATVFIFLWPLSAQALLERPAKETSWHISALKGTHDRERDLYIAEGEVVIKGGNTRLEADYVEFGNTTKDALARGHVLLISGEDTVTCDSMRLNLATETGTIYDGTVFIRENNFYIRGDKITKTGKDTYEAGKASLTSCSGDSPDWKISARDVKVTMEGYGFAKHATVWAKEMPALYSPFLAFPAKTKRQTGLLAPQYSFSDRKGFRFNLPLFLALSRNTDATLYADYMDKRGTKLGVEYRYLLANGSRGTAFLDFMDDRQIDDGTEDTGDYRYDSTPARTNTDRYWFRMKHDQNLPGRWKAKLDLDIVSDADYLHEFKSGYTGFTRTRDYFDDTFGRSVDDYDDTVRANRFNLNRTWSAYSLNMDVDWYDNVIARRDHSDDTTLQTLPAMEFDSVRQQIGKTPLYVDFDSEYRSFYRKDTTTAKTNGQRTDIRPTLYLPVRAGQYFSLEPSIGLRQTFWYSDEYDHASGNDEGFNHRELFDLNLKLSTEVSRVFNPGTGFAEKIKHEIIPALEYHYIPDVDQDDLPFFDDMDRIARRNDLTWSVTNRFISKKKQPRPAQPDKEKQGARKQPEAPLEKEEYVYHEFAWIKLFQTCYLEDQTHYDEDVRVDSSQSFSDISLESEFSPCPWLSLDMDADWSPHENHFMEHNTGLTLKDYRGDSIQGWYRYKRKRTEPVKQDPSETFYTRLDASLTSRLSAFYAYEEDLYKHERIEAFTGIEYRKDCWSLLVAYKDKPDDRSFGFIITLYGIGEFGRK
ncbi:MAG: LPS-assembly protein LptD [Desulfobacteraceae bacterium]|nr:LPS-assembly protein LptD [Desulfobacteraceae bacterium]